MSHTYLYALCYKTRFKITVKNSRWDKIIFILPEILKFTFVKLVYTYVDKSFAHVISSSSSNVPHFIYASCYAIAYKGFSNCCKKKLDV